MSDLVERLRDEWGRGYRPIAKGRLCKKAADEIERLTTVLEDAEQRVKDVQFVCDHNQAQIKTLAAENSAKNTAIAMARRKLVDAEVFLTIDEWDTLEDDE